MLNSIGNFIFSFIGGNKNQRRDDEKIGEYEGNVNTEEASPTLHGYPTKRPTMNGKKDSVVNIGAAEESSSSSSYTSIYPENVTISHYGETENDYDNLYNQVDINDRTIEIIRTIENRHNIVAGQLESVLKYAIHFFSYQFMSIKDEDLIKQVKLYIQKYQNHIVNTNENIEIYFDDTINDYVTDIPYYDTTLDQYVNKSTDDSSQQESDLLNENILEQQQRVTINTSSTSTT